MGAGVARGCGGGILQSNNTTGRCATPPGGVDQRRGGYCGRLPLGGERREVDESCTYVGWPRPGGSLLCVTRPAGPGGPYRLVPLCHLGPGLV